MEERRYKRELGGIQINLIRKMLDNSKSENKSYYNFKAEAYTSLEELWKVVKQAKN